jgi:hypothetical protein
MSCSPGTRSFEPWDASSPPLGRGRRWPRNFRRSAASKSLVRWRGRIPHLRQRTRKMLGLLSTRVPESNAYRVLRAMFTDGQCQRLLGIEPQKADVTELETKRFGLPDECNRWLLPLVAPVYGAYRLARGTRGAHLSRLRSRFSSFVQYQTGSTNVMAATRMFILLLWVHSSGSRRFHPPAINDLKTMANNRRSTRRRSTLSAGARR